MNPGGYEMGIKKIQVIFIVALVMGLVLQSLVPPAGGAESFKLRIESKYSEVELRWTEVSGATSYDIYRQTKDSDSSSKSSSRSSKCTTVEAGTLKYHDRQVSRGTSYTYWVEAKKDGVKLATSNYCVAVPGNKNTSPSAPRLSAKAYSTPRVELSWSGSGNAVYYELQQKTGDNKFQTRATIHKETKFADYLVYRGSTYTYRIRAINDYGRSDFSEEVTVSIKPEDAVPDTPTGFNAREDKYYNRDTQKYESRQSVLLSWSYEDTDAAGFIIEKRKSSEEKYAKIEANLGLNTFNSRSGGVYSYDSSARSRTYYYYDTNISSDSVYYYRIKAYNHNGESDYAREVKVATAVTRVPSQPTDLQAEAEPGRVNLTWVNNAANEEGFYIERREGSSASFSKVGTARAGASSYRDSNVSPDTIYHYRIRAFNDKGSSKYSNEVTVTTPSAPAYRKIARETAGEKADADLDTISFSRFCTLLLYDYPDTASLVKMKTVTTPPVTESATIFLPARDIAHLLDSAIAWDDTEKKVTLTYRSQIIECWAYRNTARFNGASVAVDDNDPNITPIIAKDKYIMLPLEFIQKYLDCTIECQSDGRFIKVFVNK